MTAAEQEAIAFVYELEKGYWAGNAASDPNPTLDGVTQKTYDHWRGLRGLAMRPVKQMTPEERVAIYREYWADCHAEQFDPRVAAIHFAFAFNAGPSAAAIPLQRAVGVKADGKIGPITLAAVQAIPSERLVPVLLVEQMTSYYGMAIEHQRLRPNMTSWMGRLAAGWRRAGVRLRESA